MLVEAKNLTLPSSSSSAQLQDVWKKIWKLRVPNKIRHFLWRVVKNSLPTKMNLKARHILMDDTCDCGDHAKSILHCLWLGDQSHLVWLFDLGFCFLVQKNAGHSWRFWRLYSMKVWLIGVLCLLWWHGVYGRGGIGLGSVNPLGRYTI